MPHHADPSLSAAEGFHCVEKNRLIYTGIVVSEMQQEVGHGIEVVDLREGRSVADV